MRRGISNQVRVLTIPGMNIMTVPQCTDCVHRDERNTCRLWAFPETKWLRKEGCRDLRRNR